MKIKPFYYLNRLTYTEFLSIYLQFIVFLIISKNFYNGFHFSHNDITLENLIYKVFRHHYIQ